MEAIKHIVSNNPQAATWVAGASLFATVAAIGLTARYYNITCAKIATSNRHTDTKLFTAAALWQDRWATVMNACDYVGVATIVATPLASALLYYKSRRAK